MTWGPMWHLGLKLLSDHSLRPSVREAISRVCGLQQETAADTSFVPDTSVLQLASHVELATRYAEPVLEKGSTPPVQPEGVSELGGSLLGRPRPRTLQLGRDRRPVATSIGAPSRETSSGCVGCGLAAAAADPDRLVRRFHEWVDSVWDPHSGNRPGKLDSDPSGAHSWSGCRDDDRRPLHRATSAGAAGSTRVPRRTRR